MRGRDEGGGEWRMEEGGTRKVGGEGGVNESRARCVAYPICKLLHVQNFIAVRTKLWWVAAPHFPHIRVCTNFDGRRFGVRVVNQGFEPVWPRVFRCFKLPSNWVTYPSDADGKNSVITSSRQPSSLRCTSAYEARTSAYEARTSAYETRTSAPPAK